MSEAWEKISDWGWKIYGTPGEYNEILYYYANEDVFCYQEPDDNYYHWGGYLTTKFKRDEIDRKNNYWLSEENFKKVDELREQYLASLK